VKTLYPTNCILCSQFFRCPKTKALRYRFRVKPPSSQHVFFLSRVQKPYVTASQPWMAGPRGVLHVRHAPLRRCAVPLTPAHVMRQPGEVVAPFLAQCHKLLLLLHLHIRVIKSYRILTPSPHSTERRPFAC
jgi:hypothetical protein